MKWLVLDSDSVGLNHWCFDLGALDAANKEM